MNSFYILLHACIYSMNGFVKQKQAEKTEKEIGVYYCSGAAEEVETWLGKQKKL